jgi:hypothetical protein
LGSRSNPSVYTVGDKRTTWQSKLGIGGITFALPTVRTQDEVNDSIIDLLCYVKSNSTLSVSYATEDWVQQNYAPVGHQHSEYVTKTEYNSMFATLLAAITAGQS